MTGWDEGWLHDVSPYEHLQRNEKVSSTVNTNEYSLPSLPLSSVFLFPKHAGSVLTPETLVFAEEILRANRPPFHASLVVFEKVGSSAASEARRCISKQRWRSGKSVGSRGRRDGG